MGNRLSQTSFQGTTTYAYDAADRLTSVTAPDESVTTYTYDANGNQRSAGDATYAYNAAGEMTQASVGTQSETYTWSGDGVRLSATDGTGSLTQFLVDRAFAQPMLALTADRDGAVTSDIVYGAARLALLGASSATYEHHDGLGSVADLTDPTGASLAWSEYAPYGAVRAAGAAAGAPPDPFGFTGEYTDPTGFLYLRARQYDPTTGRFLSVDPASSSLLAPSVGSYVYVADNPINGVDPSGRCPLCALVGGGIGAVAGFLGYTGSVMVLNAAEGRALSLTGWDPQQALVATATSAGAGAVCGLTVGLGCVAASAAASEVQYQLGPSQKSPLGAAGAAVIGMIGGRIGGGRLSDPGPLRWDASLVGRMWATFGPDWERKFVSQLIRSGITNTVANTASGVSDPPAGLGVNGK